MKKTVVLGVSGGIAAYKSPEIVRLLLEKEIEVHCILTEHATQFVAPLTLATLSGHPVLTGNFEVSQSGKIQHIELAEKAHLILIAPATANVIAKIAHGMADDVLTTVALARQGLLVVCPAMNVFMWENEATMENLKTLQKHGAYVVGPAKGSLACGYEALGRMEEPPVIVKEVERFLKQRSLFQGKNVLITAGPTREFLDPVRFISNPSSGKMGYALAQAAREQGANVVLISGPTSLIPPYGVTFVPVTTAREMDEAVRKHFQKSDFFISAAAVGDWQPETHHPQKLKKGSSPLEIKLQPTPDILASVSSQRKNQVLVGFAAETQSLEENARKKLKEKGLDFIVGNLVSGNGGAFGSNENEVLLLSRTGTVKAFPRMSKLQTAQAILEAVVEMKPEKFSS